MSVRFRTNAGGPLFSHLMSIGRRWHHPIPSRLLLLLKPTLLVKSRVVALLKRDLVLLVLLLLFLSGHVHPFLLRLVPRGDGSPSLASLDLLVLLDHGAEGAPVRGAEVAAAGALDVVLFADLAALDAGPAAR
jgi:hypothetical protein